MNKKIYTFTLLLHALYGLVAAGEPYCNDNETVYDFKPVHKTRTITVKPTGLLEVLKNPKTYTEEYVDQERYIKHWKLVPKCCEGYQMSTLRMCEPYCPKGCPKNASCVEPNRCQCQSGYISANASTDASYYCEPICVPRCHKHAHCLAPNVCKCKSGYAKDAQNPNTCLPQCSSGCPEEIDTTTKIESSETLVAVMASINALAKEPDENGQSTEATLRSSSAWAYTTVYPCAAGFIFYEGDCRPELFPSDENDCHFKACTAHAECLKNGSCACLEGFDWHANGSTCLSLTALNVNLERSESDVGSRWLLISLIALGVAAMVVAILYVGFKQLQREHGSLNLESKSDLDDGEYESNSNRAELRCASMLYLCYAGLKLFVMAFMYYCVWGFFKRIFYSVKKMCN